MNSAGLWFRQVRGPFLILSVVLVAVGCAAAARESHIHRLDAGLLLAGAVFAHVSVNLFNELSDFKTGIDSLTRPTPFSGGSGLLVSGRTRPGQVRFAAYASLILAALIGLRFVMLRGAWVLPFMALGGIAIRFYTSHFTRWGIGEAVSGLTLGFLLILGVCFVLTGRVSPEAVWISIPPGLLTMLLLFLNEFPDQEADRKGGRRHWVIRFGPRACAIGYTVALGLVFLLIAAAPFCTRLPRTIWLGLATIPIAFRAARITLSDSENPDLLVPALGLNVAVVIGTDALLALGLAV